MCVCVCECVCEKTGTIFGDGLHKEGEGREGSEGREGRIRSRERRWSTRKGYTIRAVVAQLSFLIFIL